MKRVALVIVIATLIFACDHESQVIPKSSYDYKAAYKIFFADYSATYVGYMYADSADKEFTVLNYDSGLLSPQGVAYNQASKRLYIAEGDGARILRESPDNPAWKLVYDTDRGVVYPTAVAVDSASKRLYWANSGTRQIMQGDLFGTQEPVAMYSGDTVISLSYGLAVDHKNNKLYVADNAMRTIMVGNLDGTGKLTTLYKGTDTDLLCPQGLVIVESTLYWADDCNSTVVSAPADGKGPIKVLFDYETDNLSIPNGVAVDKASDKIYWSDVDHGNISRGNLDGSGESEIILEGVYANSISIQTK